MLALNEVSQKKKIPADGIFEFICKSAEFLESKKIQEYIQKSSARSPSEARKLIYQYFMQGICANKLKKTAHSI